MDKKVLPLLEGLPTFVTDVITNLCKTRAGVSTSYQYQICSRRGDNYVSLLHTTQGCTQAGTLGNPTLFKMKDNSDMKNLAN